MIHLCVPLGSPVRVSRGLHRRSYCEVMFTAEDPQSYRFSVETRTPAGSLTRLGPPRWLTLTTLTWLAIYSAAHIALTLIDQPLPVSSIGPDPLLFNSASSFVSLVVCLVSVAAQAWLLPHRPAGVLRTVTAATGASASAGLMFAGALILLDLVGAVLPGIGLVVSPLGALIRLGCVSAAVLTGVHTWRFWKSTQVQEHRRPKPLMASVWMTVVGYLTVAACLTRLSAQLVVGIDENPLAAGPAMIVFESGFLLAGVLLPLALVHRWGRVWPGWVPVLSGRGVPRRLLIVCGSVLGVTMVAYFGMMAGRWSSRGSMAATHSRPAADWTCPKPSSGYRFRHIWPGAWVWSCAPLDTPWSRAIYARQRSNGSCAWDSAHSKFEGSALKLGSQMCCLQSYRTVFGHTYLTLFLPTYRTPSTSYWLI